VAADAVAEFEGVSKVYRVGLLRRVPVQAVADVTLRVEAGEVFGLLGPNRAGKTTLVKLLLSLCRPTAGRVLRLGRPAADSATLARVGYIHENPAFPRYWDAAGLLEYYGAMTLMDEPTVRRRAAELLERVGLADRCREPIAGFSKGMVQRLGLAQALLNEPDLLVLDEPAEGLDLLGRRLVHEVIGERRRQGRTVILVSHALSDVAALCDRVAVLVDGRLSYLGGLDSLTAGARPLEQAVQDLYAGAVA
jgi:ABC-2 type transport system ATP-binding protein